MASRSPRPSRQVMKLDEVPCLRRIWCRFYNDCLTTAVAEGWLGFTCNYCSVTEMTPTADRLKDFFGQIGVAEEKPN